MKLFRLLIIVPAMLIQIGCGSNSSNPNSSYYMGTNGSCMSTGGQVVPQNYCTSAYGGAYGGMAAQQCVPPAVYYSCPSGVFNMSTCTPGDCGPAGCGGALLFTSTGQQVRCQ
jgi:hypothetical protein